jgi:hypothetical protein
MNRFNGAPRVSKKAMAMQADAGQFRDVQDITGRCRATHDVPYTLRCVLAAHEDGEHLDKQGDTWMEST